MVNENTYAMITHYNGQAFLSARLSLERGETDDAEQSRRDLIGSLATIEGDEREVSEYMRFLESLRWTSPEKIDEANAKSEELIAQ